MHSEPVDSLDLQILNRQPVMMDRRLSYQNRSCSGDHTSKPASFATFSRHIHTEKEGNMNTEETSDDTNPNPKGDSLFFNEPFPFSYNLSSETETSHFAVGIRLRIVAEIQSSPNFPFFFFFLYLYGRNCNLILNLRLGGPRGISSLFVTLFKDQTCNR